MMVILSVETAVVHHALLRQAIHDLDHLVCEHLTQFVPMGSLKLKKNVMIVTVPAMMAAALLD